VISPNCIKTETIAPFDTATIDGAIVTQIARVASSYPDPTGPGLGGGPDSAFVWPPHPWGQNYHWGSLQGLFIQSELLHRAGYNAYAYGSDALKRAINTMVRAGWTGTFPLGFNNSAFVLWLANHRYGTSYTTATTTSSAWSMGWTDWTHEGTIQIAVAPTVLAFSLNVSSQKTFEIRNTGTGTLTISSISIPAGRYTVSPASGSIVAGGGPLTVTVSYASGGSGSSSQLVTIASNAPGASSVTVSCVASLAEGEEP
jgi:hypothetical protein